MSAILSNGISFDDEYNAADGCISNETQNCLM